MIKRILLDVIWLYTVIMFIRILLSYFPIDPWSSFAKVVRLFSAVTDPVLSRVRKVIPPLRVGGMGVDLSPMVVIFALIVLSNIVARA